jgi:hypothetical protein
LISPRTIVPDFVDGWAFGTAVGITLQNLHTHEWARVLSIRGTTDVNYFPLSYSDLNYNARDLHSHSSPKHR